MVYLTVGHVASDYSQIACLHVYLTDASAEPTMQCCKIEVKKCFVGHDCCFIFLFACALGQIFRFPY